MISHEELLFFVKVRKLGLSPPHVIRNLWIGFLICRNKHTYCSILLRSPCYEKSFLHTSVFKTKAFNSIEFQLHILNNLKSGITLMFSSCSLFITHLPVSTLRKILRLEAWKHKPCEMRSTQGEFRELERHVTLGLHHHPVQEHTCRPQQEGHYREALWPFWQST